MKKSLVNQKGQVLIIVLAIVAALTVYGLSLLRLTDPELKISKRQIDSTKAFYIAEAGMERAFYFVKRDGGIDDTFDITFDEPEDFGGGDYTISKTDDISFNKWTIKSTGKYNNSTRRIQVDVEVENISVWNNAICGGSGAAGAIISGNAEFRGSLHLLGEGLSSSDIAIDLSGTAGVGNNYKDMDPELLSRVPSLPTTTFNGEEVGFLNAKLRVKHGKVKLSGAANIGEEDVPGYPYIKETLQGVYIANGNGFIGGDDEGPGQNVFSDNGMLNEYDLEGVDIVFPSLDDPYSYEGAEEGATYLDYLMDTGLKVDDFDVDNEGIQNVISADTQSFERPDDVENIFAEDNYIRWNQDSGTLTIKGIIIWVTDPDDPNGPYDLVIGKSKGTIVFDGKGTLVSANDGADIFIHAHLLSNLSNGTFPDDHSLGIISAGDINIATGTGEAGLNIMGAFYAEDTITMAKQTDLVGTFVSDYVDMGSQVPKIYQVPTLAENLPPGMPGSSVNYSLIITNWREVSN